MNEEMKTKTKTTHNSLFTLLIELSNYRHIQIDHAL